MKVEKRIDLGQGHSIEFGKATWDPNSISIRNRYPTSTGGFSPRSSSEIPIEDVKLIVTESVKNGYIPDFQLIEIAEACLTKLKDTSKQEKPLTKAEKMSMMQDAATDLLFLADITETTNDFDVVDREGL
jgi:hypothetical protein